MFTNFLIKKIQDGSATQAIGKRQLLYKLRHYVE
jgi:hypothetical protein